MSHVQISEATESDEYLVQVLESADEITARFGREGLRTGQMVSDAMCDLTSLLGELALRAADNKAGAHNV